MRHWDKYRMIRIVLFISFLVGAAAIIALLGYGLMSLAEIAAGVWR